MKTDASPLRIGFAVSWGALRGPHLQRLAERWLRRWGFALSGCVLGACGVWWAQPEVNEHHADAVQAVAHLSQQLNQQPNQQPNQQSDQQSDQHPAALPETSPATSPVLTARPDKPLASAVPSPPSPQNLLAHLPAWSPHGRIGSDGPPVWAAHGLRLQSLQPLPSTSSTSPTSPTSAKSAASKGNSTGERGVGLPSQAASLRLLGRFEDWARFWAACAMAGPVCSLDRISLVATGQAGEVQIDAVLRIWMRPGEEGTAGGAGVGVAVSTERGDPERADRWRGGAVLTDSAAMAALDSTPFARSGVPLFALGREGAAPWAASAVRGAPGHSTDGVAGAAGAVGTVGASGVAGDAGAAGAGAAGSGAQAVWPGDPRHWPLAQVRLAGLWQQGAEKRAILSAGTRWAQVTLGQRVTLEGHRVAAITADGVRLRLAPGPSILLGWTGDKEGALAPMGVSKSDRPNVLGPMNGAPKEASQSDVSQTYTAKHHAAHEPRPARKGEPR